jgi:hypothetical protein
VLKVYEQLDSAVHEFISKAQHDRGVDRRLQRSGLSDAQKAEVQRYFKGEHDVVLGMLERRMDTPSYAKSCVRQAVAAELRRPGIRPAPIHHELMRLADRGGALTIVTTNFDVLLEDAARKRHRPVQTYSLGGIPRPGFHEDFSGVLHIHGALERDPVRASDLILSDQDFGEFYLRRRVVPDFIYDAARLFHLVLVGYSANDPPMRYLLNAVAADVNRFSDLKERFAFVASPPANSVDLEDWKARGITPIAYPALGDDHSALLLLLRRWADLSAINGEGGVVEAELKRIVRSERLAASDCDRDLFDHLFRRSDANERVRLSALVSKQKADLGWLAAIVQAADDTQPEGAR